MYNIKVINDEKKNMILMHLSVLMYIASIVLSIMVAVINWGYALYGHLSLNICKYLIGNKVIKTKQNKTKQNKTKQNKTKQNKTKQNKQRRFD